MRAPELPATATPARWCNTAEPVSLLSQRGRFVLLDFWTSCCANCLHVLDELRPFESEFADVLTVVGVHSPKFAHEADDDAVRAAVARYEITHPVVNDPALAAWQQYAVRAGPTLVLIDPAGYVVAQAAGEGQVSALAALLRELVDEHERAGTLRRSGVATRPAAAVTSMLRFPAKALLLPAGRSGRDADSLLVADAGHHQVVELATDGETELRRFGTGERGGPFAEPNGLALLPPGFGFDVVVADTANHVLRTIALAGGEIGVIDLPAALRGARTVTGAVPAVLSPWDVAWWPALDRLVVAAAGVHLLLAVDPRDGTAAILAGTTVEGLRDGPARAAWLAQPSGLAVDGERLWFVDAETSALRHLTVGGTVHTAVGEGLFDFGHVDGPAASARFQHPLGVTLLPDGALAVCDTYNGALRRYDPVTGEVGTLAGGLAEPSGAALVRGELVVVESAAHRLTRPTPGAGSAGRALRARRPVTDVGTEVTLTIAFTPPPGRKLDTGFGPPASLSVSASPPGLLRSGGGAATELERRLVLSPGEGTLHVTAQAATCDAAGEHPACYLARQDWGVPVRVAEGGPGALTLPLLG